MNYSELLKDPRWQKKRLKILERDKWTCQVCEEKTKTLHVHHLRYNKNPNPWEIDDNFLITLCVDCHEINAINDYIEQFPAVYFKCIKMLIKEGNKIYESGYNEACSIK